MEPLRPLIALFSFLWLAPCFAQAPTHATSFDNIGLAPYAMMSDNWPCEDQRAHDASLSSVKLAVLWNTFGLNTSCLERYFKDASLTAVEIHLINEVCQRNNNCGTYEFLYGISKKKYNRALRNRNRKLLAKLHYYLEAPANLMKKLPTTVKCYISVGLESNLTREAAQALVQEVRPYFPQCSIVWNPNGDNPHATPLKDTVFELHHTSTPLESPCIADLDGEDIAFPSRPALLPQQIPSSELPAVAKRFANCDANFLWIAEYNGLTSGSFIDPRQRTRQLFPGTSTFALMAKTVQKLSRK